MAFAVNGNVMGKLKAQSTIQIQIFISNESEDKWF